MNRLVAILASLSLTGCVAAPAREVRAVEPGVEVTLAPGEAMSAKTTEMTVRFIAVTEDSRCPRDVTCIWAGEVKVQLEIQETRKASSKVEILEGGSTVVGAHRVTLVRVSPQPVSTSRIAPQDYRATLKTDQVETP